MADQSTGIYGHWGNYAEAAQLPNVAGATLQTDILKIGDLATAQETVYQCTNANKEGAIWTALAGGGGGGSSPVLWKWNETDTTQFDLGSPVVVGAKAPETLTLVRVEGDDNGPTRLELTAVYDPTISGGIGLLIPVNDLPALPRRFVVRYEFVEVAGGGGVSYGIVGPWSDDSSSERGQFYGAQAGGGFANQPHSFVTLSNNFVVNVVNTAPANAMGAGVRVVYNSHTYDDDGVAMLSLAYVEEINQVDAVHGSNGANLFPMDDVGAAFNNFGIGGFVVNPDESDGGGFQITLSSLEILKHPMDL